MTCINTKFISRSSAIQSEARTSLSAERLEPARTSRVRPEGIGQLLRGVRAHCAWAVLGLVVGVGAGARAADSEYFQTYRTLRSSKAWFQHVELVDTNNSGPGLTNAAIAFEPFISRGECLGVRLGMTMSEAVHGWGKPRRIVECTGVGTSLYFANFANLIFHGDRLVLIALAGPDVRQVRFDNGLRGRSSREAFIRHLGLPAEAVPDDHCYDGQSRWIIGSKRVDMSWYADTAGGRADGLAYLTVRLPGHGDWQRRASASLR